MLTEEDRALSSSLLSLPHQGMMFNLFEGNSVALRARCVSKLPPEPLNACPTAMALCRYSDRHDVVLKVLSSFVTTHLTSSHSICVGSVDSEYSFPHHISPTNLQPDVVWWSEEAKEIRLLELTVSYETVMEQAHKQKLMKYEDVVERARANGFNVEYIAVEVWSRGLVVEGELQKLKDALGDSAKETTELAGDLSRTAILGSFRFIFC